MRSMYRLSFLFVLSLLFVFNLTQSNVWAQSAKDAYKSLKKLEARTATGISYKDYPQSVAEAKVEVDMFLDGKAAKKNPPFSDHLKKAMDYYLVAIKIWDIKFGFEGRSTDIVAQNSPMGKTIKSLYSKARAEIPKDPPGVQPPLRLQQMRSQMGPVYFIPEVLTAIWKDASKEIKLASEYLNSD